MTDEAGAHWLSIHRRAAGSTLKTRNSEREVSLHPELVRLGFLDYCTAMRKAGERSYSRPFPAQSRFVQGDKSGCSRRANVPRVA